MTAQSKSPGPLAMPTTEDTWSFDFYLAGVIADGVEKLRERGLGYPAELDSFEEWDTILATMAYGFRDYVIRDNCERTPAVERSLELLTKWWGHLWD